MYFADRGRRHGIAYELLTAFEEAINKRYAPSRKHIKTHVAFVPVSWDQLIPALLRGSGDIAVADVTITPERQGQIDFSEPFFFDINEILVTGPTAPNLASLGDLSGREIFVQPASSYREHLDRLNECFRRKGIAPVKLRFVPEELGDEDLMEMANAGLLRIIVVDDYKAELWSEVFPDIELHPEIQINSGGEFAWMMRKGSPQLMATVNAFARTHRQGTSFGNLLVRRYVDETKFVQRATSPDALKKFQQLVDLFRRYADQYELDHLLLMAQGYQESRLIQKARSRVGAIGVMQLMPATGRQMRVGDVTKLEPNIHAGVKYHGHLIDHYFKDEPMDALNRTLFAFAAYNAGPGRIRGLRKAAEKRGLDPNVWFNNVELVAAQKIGFETVSYVANIFKYYVAYRLLAEQEESRRSEKGRIQDGR